MRVYYTGDCHFDFDDTGTSFANFKNQIKNIKQNDLLIIFGDIHNNRKERIKILKAIDEIIKCKCVFVLGNHDFWNIPVNYSNISNIKIDFIDDVQKLKNEEFNRIIILDNEIKKINGLKIMGSSGYFILSTFEWSAYFPAEYSRMLKLLENKALTSKLVSIELKQVCRKYFIYFSKKYKEWISLYNEHFANVDIVITHQPTWTWMNGKEKLWKNIKYINGHDHYKLDVPFTKRIRGDAYSKTSDNNYNDGQNTYYGKYKKSIKYFEI